MISKLARAAAAFLIVGGLAGCALGPRLSNGPALSKAKGTVRYEKTLGHGTRIFLKVKNLAEPEDLHPPGYAYVAWVQSDREAPPQNVGALTVDDDQFGELRTITALRDFELFVTAEASSDVLKPSGPPLLWAHRDERITLFRRDERGQFAGDAP